MQLLHISSSCYLWNWCCDIKWLVGRIRTTQQMCTLFVHTMNLPEDCCLLECDSLWSVRHTHPSVGCIPQEDAASIFEADLSMKHCPQKCQYTCVGLHAIISHKTVIFILTPFKVSNLAYKIACLDQLLNMTTAVASSKNMSILKLQYICQ